MFNRLPGAMLSEGHTHQWGKGCSCCPVLSQHTSATRHKSQTCLIRHRRGQGFQAAFFVSSDTATGREAYRTWRTSNCWNC